MKKEKGGKKLDLTNSKEKEKGRQSQKGDNKMKRRPDIDGQVVAGVLSRPVITSKLFFLIF